MEYLELIMVGVTDIDKIRLFVSKLKAQSICEIANEPADVYRDLNFFLSSKYDEDSVWSPTIIYRCGVLSIDKFRMNDVNVFVRKNPSDYDIEFSFHLNGLISNEFLDTWFEFAVYLDGLVRPREFYMGLEPAHDIETRYFTNYSRKRVL